MNFLISPLCRVDDEQFVSDRDELVRLLRVDYKVYLMAFVVFAFGDLENSGLVELSCYIGKIRG